MLNAREDGACTVAFRGWRHALIGAAALAVLCGLSNAAASQPLNTREQAALDVRYLQTELMVAALSCGRADFHQHYNVFVAKFGKSLKSHANVMKTYFSREYGAQGTTQLDRYVTRLANEASLRSMQQAAFCQDSSYLFERVTALDPASLDGFSATIARNREMVASGPQPAR
jgi:hypothetical protein